MPLSSSDVQFLNKLLDKRLKFHQGWPWIRYAVLTMGLLMTVAGTGIAFSAVSMAHYLDLAPPATRKAYEDTTRPATYAQLMEVKDFSVFQGEFGAKLESTIVMTTLMSVISGMFLFLVGFNLVGHTLIRWNQHRRDAILITLLREKCAIELASPASS